MSEDTGKILPLPPDVATQIESSATIPSLCSVVVGLVENSLDARARRIDINVDFGRGSCIVEDDGHGIPPSDFGPDGGLGKPCYTSKHEYQQFEHGSNGLFLSAVAALSILTITSHHQSYKTLSTLILHHSKVAARRVPAATPYQLFNNLHGTRVTVQDLFGNMPVRVKQRAVHFGACQQRDRKELDRLKKRLVALLLAWPYQVSLTLTTGSSNRRQLNVRLKNELGTLRASDAAESSCLQLWNITPTKQLDVSWLCSILLQAGYIEPPESNAWVRMSARTSAITARGVLSAIPAPSKQVQFISLGVKPVQTEMNANMLLDEINKMFAASNFGNMEILDKQKEYKKANDRRYKQDGLTNKELKWSGKAVDRWPMFYICIDLNDCNGIQNLGRQSVLSSSLKVVRALIHGFLEDHHFGPRARARRPRIQPSRCSPLSITAPVTSDAFSSWSRIKSSSASVQNIAEPSATEFDGIGEAKIGEANNVKLATATEGKSYGMQSGDPQATADNQDELIDWVNPVTKEKVLINSRTGLASTRGPSQARPNTALGASQIGTIFAKGRPTFEPSILSNQPSFTSWASNLLAQWENPVFAHTEEAIPRTFNETNLGLSDIATSHKHCCPVARCTSNNRSDTANSRISRTALASARVVSQVDKKFVLITMPMGGSSRLVLVDQHAADERIRVEALLEDFHNQRPTILAKPMTFDISARELAPLSHRASYFAQFGIKYTISPTFAPELPHIAAQDASSTAKYKLIVSALPPVIAERCRLQPSILLDLLRSISWSQSGQATRIASLGNRPSPPKEVLDIINSRACRSAIMFNDPLTQSETEELIHKLSTTRMPFQCAHGRTSMVPLLEVNKEPIVEDRVVAARKFSEQIMYRGNEPVGLQDEDETFTAAWKRWRRHPPD